MASSKWILIGQSLILKTMRIGDKKSLIGEAGPEHDPNLIVHEIRVGFGRHGVCRVSGKLMTFAADLSDHRFNNRLTYHSSWYLKMLLYCEKVIF